MGTRRVRPANSGRKRYWTTDIGQTRVLRSLRKHDLRLIPTAEELGCCYATVRKVYGLLEQQGLVPLLNRRRRRGSEGSLYNKLSLAQRDLHVRMLMDGDTQEIDFSECRMARLYDWCGRMYGSELIVRLPANEQLLKRVR